MSDQPLNEQELAALTAFDTPTICNALELLVPERRAMGFTTSSLVAPFPELPPMVGYARTCTIRAAEPSSASKESLRKQRFDYFDYVASKPGPTISIVQDLDDGRPGFGSFWGEVNSNIHRALGCLGTVTNGSIRDIDAIAEGFRMLAGKVGPSHAHVHMVEFGCDVSVGGMNVCSGDLVHADRHGAVVIPHAVARKVPEAAALLGRREAVILDVCRGSDFTVEKLKQAIGAADEIH